MSLLERRYRKIVAIVDVRDIRQLAMSNIGATGIREHGQNFTMGGQLYRWVEKKIYTHKKTLQSEANANKVVS